MKLENLRKNWEGLGEDDPFWAVLSEPSKINNKWDEAEFFESGRAWVDHVFNVLSLNERLNFGSALDFGCGPGRLTQALCNKFDSVTGVDISASMIERADSLNSFGTSCNYLVNTTNDLSQIPSGQFDYVQSYITLQHISPVYVFNYIKEFKRILKDGGHMLFNLPTKPPIILNVLLKLIGQRGVNMIRQVYYRKRNVIEMHWIKQDEMLRFLEANQLELVEMIDDGGVGSTWESNMYLLKKI